MVRLQTVCCIYTQYLSLILTLVFNHAISVTKQAKTENVPKEEMFVHTTATEQ